MESNPHRVRLQAELANDGMVILADRFDAGWKCHILVGDTTKAIPVYRANRFMRAVKLPEGSYELEFRYQPVAFRIGAFVTLATLVSLTLFGVFGARKRARRVSR